MDVGAPFVAHDQTAETAQPGERALDHPAMAAQLLTGLDSLAGNARLNMPGAARPATGGGVIGKAQGS